MSNEVFPDVRFDAILFDMDGTLIDSTAAVERSWLLWANEEGIDPDTLLKDGHGQPALKLVAAAVPAQRVASSLARLTHLEEHDVEGVRILPGIPKLLGPLPPDQWAIVTSSTKNLAYIRLRAAGVRPPSVVITFDDVARGKPDPEPFLKGAHALGADPSRCLVVEDSIPGLIAGRRAGSTTLAITGTHDSAELAEHGDAVVESFEDLVFVRRSGGLSLVVRQRARA